MSASSLALPLRETDLVTGGGDRAQRIKAIVGASSGNLVEWYDFYAYAFTSIYFAPAFFPKAIDQPVDGHGRHLRGRLPHAAARRLAVRPHRRPHGRKNSMVISVLMMCGGSLMIALLPTYATIGAAAPALLLVARLIQGLSVGGEYGTAATYMSEVAGKGNRGLLFVVPVRDADRRPAAGAARAGAAAGAAVGGRAQGLGLAHPVRHRRRDRGRRDVSCAARWTKPAPQEAMHSKEAGSLSGLLKYKRSVLIVLGLHDGRFAVLLHVHDLHAEVPGQHGAHGRPRRSAW